jgi:hypothetical protein
MRKIIGIAVVLLLFPALCFAGSLQEAQRAVIAKKNSVPICSVGVNDVLFFDNTPIAQESQQTAKMGTQFFLGGTYTLTRFVLPACYGASGKTLETSLYQDNAGDIGTIITNTTMTKVSANLPPCDDPNPVTPTNFDFTVLPTLAQGTYWIAAQGTDQLSDFSWMATGLADNYGWGYFYEMNSINTAMNDTYPIKLYGCPTGSPCNLFLNGDRDLVAGDWYYHNSAARYSMGLAHFIPMSSMRSVCKFEFEVGTPTVVTPATFDAFTYHGYICTMTGNNLNSCTEASNTISGATMRATGAGLYAFTFSTPYALAKDGTNYAFIINIGEAPNASNYANFRYGSSVRLSGSLYQFTSDGTGTLTDSTFAIKLYTN